MSDKEVDLDEVKTFFDPHPGLLGALAPIPNAVRKVANELNGKKMPLREAVEKIKAVTNGDVSVSVDCIILLFMSVNGGGHGWRVIKFKD